MSGLPLTTGFLLFLIAILFSPSYSMPAITAGYLLGLVSVLLHFAFLAYIKKRPDNSFLTLYYLSLLPRLLVICAVFVILIIFTKIDEIGFTVSFIISYIFHSVNEIILLNRQLSSK